MLISESFFINLKYRSLSFRLLDSQMPQNMTLCCELCAYIFKKNHYKNLALRVPKLHSCLTERVFHIHFSTFSSLFYFVSQENGSAEHRDINLTPPRQLSVCWLAFIGSEGTVAGCWRKKIPTVLLNTEHCRTQYQPSKQVTFTAATVALCLWSNQLLSDWIWDLLHAWHLIHAWYLK